VAGLNLGDSTASFAVGNVAASALYLGSTKVWPTATSSISIVAHEDDELGFINPDVLEAIGAGIKSTAVYLTAGNASQAWGTGYATNRENGVQAAWAEMAGVANSWTSTMETIAGKQVQRYDLVGSPGRIYFLRLNNVNSLFDSPLKNLWNGTVTSLTAIDPGAQTYTKAELLNVLSAIITAQQVATVRVLNWRDDFAQDHWDHTAAGRFGHQAYLNAAPSATLLTYVGNQAFGGPVNLSSAQQTAKTNAVNAYKAFDSAFNTSDPGFIPSMQRRRTAYGAVPASTPSQSGNVFGSTAPASTANNSNAAETLANAFQVTANRVALGGRIFIPTSAGSTADGTGYVAQLWRASASGVLSDWMAGGVGGTLTRGSWLDIPFATPVMLIPGETYYLSVHTPRGWSGYIDGKFTSALTSTSDSALIMPAKTTMAQGIIMNNPALATAGQAPGDATSAAGLWLGVDLNVGIPL